MFSISNVANQQQKERRTAASRWRARAMTITAAAVTSFNTNSAPSPTVTEKLFSSFKDDFNSTSAVIGVVCYSGTAEVKLNSPTATSPPEFLIFSLGCTNKPDGDNCHNKFRGSTSSSGYNIHSVSNKI
eukprot:sb/3475289/